MNLLSRRRNLMSAINKGVLPYEYQQVEYLEGTGTQWINTGFVANQDTRVVCEYQFTTKYANPVFGARMAVRQDAFCLNVGAPAGTNVLVTSYNDSGNVIVLNATKDFTKHKADKNKNLFYLDGELLYAFPSGQIFNTVGELEIFAVYNGGTKGYLPSTLRIFCFQLYDNGALIRDFIPCYRKSDNEAGLYDLVDGKFYTNQGTGEFIIGGNIN